MDSGQMLPFRPYSMMRLGFLPLLLLVAGLLSVDNASAVVAPHRQADTTLAATAAEMDPAVVFRPTSRRYEDTSIFKEDLEPHLTTEPEYYFKDILSKNGKLPDWILQDPEVQADMKEGLLVELASLRPFIEDNIVDNIFESIPEPLKLYTIADLMKLVKKNKRSELNDAELIIFHAVNNDRLDGIDRTLESTIKDMERFQKQLFTAEDAMKLDGLSSQLLSPMEEEARNHANADIIRGVPKSVDLLNNHFRALLKTYRQVQAPKDAEIIYEAIYGLGTDEAAIMSVLEGKSTREIKALTNAYITLLSAKGKSTLDFNNDSPLERDIKDDVSLGWQEKILDAYYARPVQEDQHYFWSHKFANHWNKGLKIYKAMMLVLSKHEKVPSFVKMLAEQQLFSMSIVSYINERAEAAKEHWLNKVDQSTGFARKLYFIPLILSSAGYNIVAPLKALDPDLTPEQTREGLIEITILLTTLGVGKVIHLAAKTATGAKAAMQLARVVRRMKVATRSAIASKLEIVVKWKKVCEKAVRDLNKVLSSDSVKLSADAIRNTRRARKVFGKTRKVAESLSRFQRVASKSKHQFIQAKKHGATAEELTRLANVASKSAEKAKKEYIKLYVYQANAARAEFVARSSAGLIPRVFVGMNGKRKSLTHLIKASNEGVSQAARVQDLHTKVDRALKNLDQNDALLPFVEMKLGNLDYFSYCMNGLGACTTQDTCKAAEHTEGMRFKPLEGLKTDRCKKVSQALGRDFDIGCCYYVGQHDHTQVHAAAGDDVVGK